MAEETVEVGGDSREAVRELEQLRDKAVQVSRSLGGMATEATMTGLAVVGLDNVVAVLQRTVEFASESMGAFLERNQGAARSARVASTAVDALKTQLGAAALGGGNAQVIFGELTQILSTMTSAVNESQEQIQTLTRQGIADLIEGLAHLTVATFDAVEQLEKLYNVTDKVWTVVSGTVLRPFIESVEFLGLAAEGTAPSVDEMAERIGDISERQERATERTNAMRGAVDGLARSTIISANNLRYNRQNIDGIIDSTNEAIERFGVLSALFGNAETAPPPPPPPPPSRAPVEIEEAEEQITTLERLANGLREVYSDVSGALVDAWKEIGTEFAEGQADRARQTLEKEQEQAEALQAQAQQNAEKMIAIDADALERRKVIAGEAAGLTGSLVGQLAAGEEKALDVIKSFLGQELMARGQALMIEGGATMVIPGMQGVAALKIAAGTAMTVAGARMARQGAGSGTAVETGGAPIPASSTPQASATVTQQVSFGIVGDPRAAAALVSDATRTAMREGMRGAA